MSTIIQMSEKALPPSCYLFKHSTTCGISAGAAREVRALVTELPIYWVNVREQRDLSNWVAETYGVAHESPQLILIREGKAQQAWSHYDVHRSNVTA
jgi:bacillithiol system protein YtxJ